jgi:hypothetical protein
MPNYTFTENTTAQNSADTPTTGVTEDSGLTQADPTSNQDLYGNYEASRFGTNDHNNIIIRFDTSSIPDSETVTSATLYMYHEANNGEGHTINVYEELNDAWTEGSVTWNTEDGSTAWNTAGCRGSGTDRSSSTVGSTAISATTSEYKSFSLSASVINLTGNTSLLLEMDSGDGESGDYTTWTRSENTDGQRPELVVVTTTGGGGSIIPLISHHIRQMRQ